LTFDLLIQSVITGLSLGVVYMIMALGLTLIFGILGIINLAHGVFYMIGAYVVYYIYTVFGLNFYLAMLAMIITLGLLGLVTERVFLRSLGGKFAPVVVMTIALLILLETLGILTFGILAKGVSSPITGISTILGVGISNYQLLLLAIAAILVSALYYLIYKTRTGLAIRALEEDKVAAALQGINVNRTYTFIFCLGVALAGTAGALVAPLYSLLPTMGSTPLIKAFIIIILGGMGSIPGAIVGALVIGLADSVLAVAVGAEMAYILTWLLVVVVLILRPRGLLGAY